MHTPRYLKKGDKVMIVAPARKITQEEIEPARKIFESWGLKVEYGHHLFGSNFQFSGNDEERLSDFQYALDDVGIRAIICARGGYGSVRIIDDLDFSKFIKDPKWIIGFSDATVFLSHISQNFGIESIHAEMPVNLGKKETDPNVIQSLKDALFGNALKYEFMGSMYNHKGTAQGELIGGNLSMLYSLLGSPSDIDTKGKILFLEDLDEYLYHIDRMMTNLKRNGKLEDLAGLVIGDMNDMNDNQIPFGKCANMIIAEHVEDYEYPVCFGFPAGHIPNNNALIMGRKVTMNVVLGRAFLEFDS